MIPYHVHVDQSSGVFTDLPIRSQRRVMKATMGSVALMWRNRMLMQHFRSGAASKYNYQRRSRKYVERKRLLARFGAVEAGGRLPLVFRGLLRRAMKALHRIAAYWSRALVHLVGPSYFKRTIGSSRPNLVDETLTVTSDEDRELTAHGEQTWSQEVQNAKPRQRRKRIL